MFERIIQIIRTDDAGIEEPSATRERLKAQFPPPAARRMTQLGMMVSAILNDLNPSHSDTIIYASQFSEIRALETFLDSFPEASPTGFQTSIHPGAIQQGMIRRAQPAHELFPVSGRDNLAGQSLLAAMLSPAPRAILCGGEERGNWLTAIDAAGDRSFAYGMLLTREPGAGAPVGHIALEQNTVMEISPSQITSPDAWFGILHARKKFSGPIMPGWSAHLTWM